MNLTGCYLHNTDHWATPKKLYNHLINNGWLDPCPLHCEEDNLGKIYPPLSKIYINPPYSDIKSWVTFIENNLQSEILLLIPSRTDTKAFAKLAKLHPFTYFITGRLKFNDSKQSAPFPSVLMYFTPLQIPKLPLYVCMTLDDFIGKFK